MLYVADVALQLGQPNNHGFSDTRAQPPFIHSFNVTVASAFFIGSPYELLFKVYSILFMSDFFFVYALAETIMNEKRYLLTLRKRLIQKFENLRFIV